MEKLILVVDDDPELRGVTAIALEEEGYRVAVAANGQEALDMLRAGLRPCLILADLMMPVMSGWELRNELQRDALLAGIPLVFITGYTHMAPTGAANVVLEKPVGLDQLLSRVEELLEAA